MPEMELIPKEQRTQINNDMPADAKYGDVFEKIAEAQLAADKKVLEAKEKDFAEERVNLFKRYDDMLAQTKEELEAERKKWAEKEAIYLHNWMGDGIGIDSVDIQELKRHIAQLRKE